MPYIPEGHLKYDVLPYCRKHGGEVFEYPSSLINKAAEILGSYKDLFPYGFESYEDYCAAVDKMIAKHSEMTSILQQIKDNVQQMNQKEDWSILKYIGPADNNLLGLTHGHTYYWPTSRDNPVFSGVIDDEEFTSYLYPTNAEFWEILEDPTGMAYRTIYENGTGGISSESYNHMIASLRKVAVEDPTEAKKRCESLSNALSEQIYKRYKKIILPNGRFFQTKTGVIFRATTFLHTDADDIECILEFASNEDEADYNAFEDGCSFLLTMYDSPEEMIAAVLDRIDTAEPDPHARIKCPCCKQDLLEQYQVCKSCSWRHDPKQLTYPDSLDGANVLSLNRARQAWYDLEFLAIMNRRGCEITKRPLKSFLGCRVIIEVDPYLTHQGKIIAYSSPEENEDGVESIIIDDERTSRSAELKQSDFLNIMEIYE